MHILESGREKQAIYFGNVIFPIIKIVPPRFKRLSLPTTVVGLIHNNETAYREEVKDLVMWCQDNNLSLNVIKTKELIVDYRKKRTAPPPLGARLGGSEM